MEEDKEIPGAAGAAGAAGKKEEMPLVAGTEEEVPGVAGKGEEVPGVVGKKEEVPGVPIARSQCCLEAALPKRWCVSYTTLLICRKKPTHKGSMILRADLNRIVLYDSDKDVIDVRSLNEGELIYPGSVVYFPCHMVDVGECIFQPDTIIKNEDDLAPSPITCPQQLSGAVEHQLASSEDKDGDGHLLGNVDEPGVDKKNSKKRRNKKDEKKAKRRKLQEEQEMRDEKKRKLDEEQELRDAKKKKRLKAAAGMRLVRSPVAMIAKVMSLKKQMSPQANSGCSRKPRKLKSIVWKETLHT